MPDTGPVQDALGYAGAGGGLAAVAYVFAQVIRDLRDRRERGKNGKKDEGNGGQQRSAQLTGLQAEVAGLREDLRIEIGGFREALKDSQHQTELREVRQDTTIRALIESQERLIAQIQRLIERQTETTHATRR